jgi:hypothetical protein
MTEGTARKHEMRWRVPADRKVFLSTGLSVRHSAFGVRTSSGVFLGKVIRLTAGHQAKVEEKPEVRKAGGVYYTPTYIVDYIVKNTVGRPLEAGPAERLTTCRIRLACSRN